MLILILVSDSLCHCHNFSFLNYIWCGMEHLLWHELIDFLIFIFTHPNIFSWLRPWMNRAEVEYPFFKLIFLYNTWILFCNMAFHLLDSWPPCSQHLKVYFLICCLLYESSVCILSSSLSSKLIGSMFLCTNSLPKSERIKMLLRPVKSWSNNGDEAKR